MEASLSIFDERQEVHRVVTEGADRANRATSLKTSSKLSIIGMTSCVCRDGVTLERWQSFAPCRYAPQSNDN